ncbi:MAG TPA: long-chain fatty acid--CoA ligase, partial [Thermoanaerobaculia bacterium]
NFEKLERDASSMGISFKSRDELVGNDRVKAIFQTEIDRFNRNLDRQEKIRRFALLPRDFTIEADEITPSLKVKRKVIDKKYKNIIDELYIDDGADDERESKRA